MNKKEVYGGLLSCITAVAGIDNAKKFGELTFSPDCCVFPNFPQSFLDEMGKKLRI